MVSRSAHESKTVKKHKHFWLLLLLFFMVAGISIGICYLVQYFAANNSDSGSEGIDEAVIESGTEMEERVIEPIDFQNIVDDFVSSVSGNVSVIIYDLDRDQTVGQYNSTENYSTASLYKLFVAYEGYRRIESGEWGPEENAGATGYNILECLDLAIRESHSSCAETLWDKIGRTELDDIVVSNYQITNSKISQLESNPEDILKIMKLFYSHPDIQNENLIAQIKDSFLDQPATAYNWRQGLPSGFIRANVYNKVGWDFNPNGNYWNIYHDTAIIEFPEEDRHFIVVVMTNHVPYQKITEFGTNIENTFYDSL